MSVDHYENFPVASILCPPALRPAVVALYHYARTADDIADHVALSAAEKIRLRSRSIGARARAISTLAAIIAPGVS